jgi:transposase-like protein
MPVDEAAGTLGVSRSTIKRWRRQTSELANGLVPVEVVER